MHVWRLYWYTNNNQSSMRAPKLNLEEKIRKRKEAEEKPYIREGVLTSLLIDVTSAFNVPLSTIQSGDRQELTVLCRTIFYQIARIKTDYGLLHLAKTAGRRNHTSVFHRLRIANGLLKDKDAELLTLWNHYLSNSKLFTKKDFPWNE